MLVYEKYSSFKKHSFRYYERTLYEKVVSNHGGNLELMKKEKHQTIESKAIIDEVKVRDKTGKSEWNTFELGLA